MWNLGLNLIIKQSEGWVSVGQIENSLVVLNFHGKDFFGLGLWLVWRSYFFLCHFFTCPP